MVIVGIAVALSVVFSLRFGAPNDSSSSNEYAPNETRSISYSTNLCQSVTAEWDSVLSYSNSRATFYLLSETPPLNDHDEFAVTDRELFSAYGAYHYWSYYLYPGSNFNASVCKDDSVNMKFYLIKGQKNFNKWTDNPSSKYALHTESVGSRCPSRNSNYTYNVKTEGDYYLVYYLNDYKSTYLSVDLDFYRTKYTVDPSKVISNCTLDLSYFYSSCTLDIPMTSNVGVVSLDNFSDFAGSIPLSFDCGARIWLYSVISLATVAVIVLIIVSVIVVCCCCKKKKYTPLDEDNQPAPVTTGPAPSTATYVTGTQPPPPPYNQACKTELADQPPKYY